MTGASIDRCQIWQAWRIAKNYCHYWIHRSHFVLSTKFHQNWSICRSSSKTMAWQMTGANIDRCYKLQKTIATNELTALDLWRVQNFIKIEAFLVLRPKLWREKWQVPILAGIKNHRKLLSSMNSAPSNCLVCKVSWKIVNLIRRSPFPIYRSRFPFLKMALKNIK